MKAKVCEFKDHDFITYKVDEFRFIRMVNYALNLDCYPEKYSTFVEFVANSNRIMSNPRKAIYTTGTNYWVYSGENALFEEYKNEIAPYFDTPFEFIKNNNINLNEEDIKVFGDFLLSNI